MKTTSLLAIALIVSALTSLAAAAVPLAFGEMVRADKIEEDIYTAYSFSYLCSDGVYATLHVQVFYDDVVYYYLLVMNSDYHEDEYFVDATLTSADQITEFETVTYPSIHEKYSEC